MSVSSGNITGNSGFAHGQQQSSKFQMNGQSNSGPDTRRNNRRRGPSGNNNNNNNNGGNGGSSNKDRRLRSKTSNDKRTPPANNSTNSSSTKIINSISLGIQDDEQYNTQKKVIPKQKPDQLQNYTALEIELTGPIFPNPSQLGFRQKQHKSRPRPIPKYLMHQPRLLVTPPFFIDPWDANNQQKMLSMEQAAGGKDFQSLYEEFQKMRDVERKQMEVLGLVDAENVSKDLTDAIHFQGSCLEMCPIFERVRRALENNVKNLERDPATGKISRERAIKAFSRPAAGQPPPLPSEVRPPHVLVNTLNYLVDNSLSLLPESHSFIWDRTRSIRQDFTYQNFFGPEAIDCNEKIVRIHLLCLHVMAGAASEGGVEYSQQQELEQFNKALQTLLEIYKDIRNHGGEAPNEAEFRAYYLLSHLRDPEQEREVQQLPNHIINDPFIQLAFLFRNLVCQSNIVERGYHNTVGSLLLFEEFFKIVRSAQVPFLMSCLLETHFNEIRFYALKSMSRSYHTKSKPYPADKLQKFLAFDHLEQLIKFVQYYEVDIINDNQGKVLVDLFNKDKLETVYKLNSIHDKPKLSPAYTRAFDQKFLMNGGNGENIRALIDSGKSNNDLKLKSATTIRKVSNRPASNLALPALLTPSTILPSFLSGPPPTNVGTKSLSDFLNSGANNSGSGGGFSFGSATGGSFGSNSAGSFGNTVVSGTGATDKALANTFGEKGKSVEFSIPKTAKPTPLDNAVFGNTVKENSLKPNVPSIPNPPVGNFRSSGQPVPLFKNDSAKPGPLFGNKEFVPPTNISISAPPSLNFSKLSDDENPLHGRDVPTTVTKPQPIPPTTTSNTFSPTPQTISQPPKALRLVESNHYATASNQVYQDLLSKVIESELGKMLPKFIEQLNSNIRNAKLIQSTRNEVFQNLLDGLVKYKLLEVQADHFYQNSLRKKSAKLLVRKGKETRSKAIMRERKRQELQLIKFTGSSRLNKRQKSATYSPSSDTSTSSIVARKRMKLNSISPSYIDETQKSVERLWEPIDLKAFLNRISSKIKIKLESKDIEFNFLILVENWESNYSKWLNNKLGMVANRELLCYEKFLASDRLKLKFTSLPPGNYESKKFFSKSPFIIFECGKTIDSSSSMSEKLQADKEKLLKLIKLLNGYSFYKAQLVLIYWDCTGTAGYDSEDILTELDIDSFRLEDCLQSIDLIDMTDNQDINEKLDQAFIDLSSGFKGELTTKGQRKISKLKKRMSENNTQRQSVPTPSAASISPADYDLKEQEQLSKAKALRKYDYLSKHISNSNSFANSTNTSFVTAYNIFPGSDTTRNGGGGGGAYNTSQYFPNTFLNNSTFNDSTMINPNVSILGGFGNGIVGESTPFSSPGKNKIKKPTLGNIPKGLLELKELTQGIKKKYNRK